MKFMSETKTQHQFPISNILRYVFLKGKRECTVDAIEKFAFKIVVTEYKKPLHYLDFPLLVSSTTVCYYFVNDRKYIPLNFVMHL